MEENPTDKLRPIDKELLDACSDLDEERVLAALDAGANPNVINDGSTPMLACLHGDRGESRLFNQARRDNNRESIDSARSERSCDDATWETVESECDDHRIRIFKMLVEHGADINLDLGEEAELLWHAVHHSPTVVEALLSMGADPNFLCSGDTDDHTSPLEHAWIDQSCYRSDVELERTFAKNGRLLLSYGAVPLRKEEITETTVDLSSIRNFEMVPPFVYPAIPENVPALSGQDRTLFKACEALDESAVRRAFASGANPNARDSEEEYRTPLFAVAEEVAGREWEETSVRSRKAISIAKLLFERGADPNLPRVNETRECGKDVIEGSTPLQYAAWLAKDIAFSEFLLQHGANPNLASSTPGGEEATVSTMNGWDYNVDDPAEVKAIEELLCRYGGCHTYIFDPDDCSKMRDVDAALVFACQRLDYENVQLAAKLGGNLNLRDGSRTLPVVALNDAPQLRAKQAADHGWILEEEVTNFLLFLLVGMKVPLDCDGAKAILEACADNGYEETMETLVGHHSLGPLFRDAATTIDTEDYPWTCWPFEKRTRMLQALRLDAVRVSDCQSRGSMG